MIHRRALLGALALMAVLALCCATAPALAEESLLVRTDAGLVEGFVEGRAHKWLGMRYAAAPTGERRFAMPHPVEHWSGVRPAKEPAPICPQLYLDFLDQWLGEEDCLALNVVAPADRSSPDLLPVWVFIHGGGWTFGDGIEFGLYDARRFAERNRVVVVTINYRLGPLGFLALPALRKENEHTGAVGNWGLYDQLAALRWVQNNIAGFGGNPSMVTIGGESAGAFSTCVHRTSPLSHGLFRGAIMQSGTCASEHFFVPLEQSMRWGETFVAKLGCDPNSSDVLRCLRALNQTQVMGPPMDRSWQGFVPPLFPALPWAATIDGHLLPDSPMRLIQSGNVSRVPTLAGSNKDEGSLFIGMMHAIVPGLSDPLQPGELDLILRHFWDNNQTVVDGVNRVYPIVNYPNATWQARDMLRDYFFLCPTSRALLAFEEVDAPVWNYQFTYPGNWIENPYIGTYHSFELQFVFGNEWPPFIHPFSTEDWEVSASFQDYWSAFMRDGDPNGSAQRRTPQKEWPRYSRQKLLHQRIDVPVSVEQGLEEAQCQFWDTIAEPKRISHLLQPIQRASAGQPQRGASIALE